MDPTHEFPPFDLGGLRSKGAYLRGLGCYNVRSEVLHCVLDNGHHKFLNNCGHKMSIWCRGQYR